jgi:hypothetical protein
MAFTKERSAREQAEADNEAKKQAQLPLYFSLALDGFTLFGTSPADSNSMIGSLGASLFEDGDGEVRDVVGPDGKHHRQRFSPSSRLDPESQKAFNALTYAADSMGVPRNLLFQLAYATKHGGTLAGNEGQRESIIEAVDYLNGRNWGQKFLASHPQLNELKDGIQKLSGLQGQDYLDALNKDPRLSELMRNRELGAILSAATARRMLEAKGDYAPESGKFLSPEDMKDVAGQLFLNQHFTEARAKDILSKLGDASPYFTKTEIDADPALKEFEGKSAQDILAWAKDKMNVDVSPLLQTAPSNIPIAANYNEMDRQIFHGVNIGSLKAAIFGNESAYTKSPYEAEGPVCSNGDHAYGKYQVMGNNIPEWTRKILGREMTPAEFLKDHDAQEMVASTRLAEYVERSWRLHDGDGTTE